MTKISLIAAVDEQLGLGKNNQLLCHLPADLKHFKALTLGKPILMGHNTFTSIGRPLPQRQNIVLSRSPLEHEGIEVVHSLENALLLVEGVSELMVIGGASIFEQIWPRAKKVYLTRIHHLFESDVYFPAINEDNWTCVSREFRLKDEKNPYDMTFEVWQLKGSI